MKLHVLKKADYREMPWKNGRGSTLELAIWPEGASFPKDPFDWRLSAARIGEAGDFSVFPGCDRTLVIWEGEGLKLWHGDRSRSLLSGVSYSFSGDIATRCELLSGPVRDLGLIVRRDRGGAFQVEWLDFESLAPRAFNPKQASALDHLLCVCTRGRVRVEIVSQDRASQKVDLNFEETLWIQDASASMELRWVPLEVGTIVFMARREG